MSYTKKKPVVLKTCCSEGNLSFMIIALMSKLLDCECIADESNAISRGWKAVSIHGDKAQHERTKALSLFKEGSNPLMVCLRYLI